MMPSLPTPKPGLLFLPGCAIAAGLLTVSLPTSADSKAATAITAPLSLLSNETQKLRVGQTLTFPLSATVHVEEGQKKVLCTTEEEYVSIKALGAGVVKIRIEAEDQAPQLLTLNIAPKNSRTKAGADVSQYVMRRESAQIVPAPTPEPLPDFLRDIPAPTTGTAATPTPTAAPGAGVPILTPDVAPVPSVTPTPTPEPVVTPTPAPIAPASNDTTPVIPPTTTPSVDSTAPAVPPVGDATIGLPPLAPVETLPGGVAPQTLPPTDLPPATTTPATPPAAEVPAPLYPADTAPPAINPAPLAPVPPVAVPTPTPAPRVAPPTRRVVPTTQAGGAQVLPNQPIPAANPKVPYRTSSKLPNTIKPGANRSGIDVTQGLARLLRFPSNILSVFFSDPAVMDARAINARTIAVTGVAPGESTLAVFTSRFAGDVIGQASIYRIKTTPRGNATLIDPRNPEVLETAIESAIGDPRVRVNVNRLPNGNLSVRLLGTVRNDAEVQGAVTTARLYVPAENVVSSLYADATTPSIDQVLTDAPPAITPQGEIQENLRRITGNSSIELIPLPTGLGLKAEVNSPEEAEQLLRVVPTLNQQVLPFIVVRGSATSESPYYNSPIPLLQGEDLQLTQKLQSVTGIRTVYATRASGNSVAIYGSVRTRGEYEAVKRYGLVIAQTSNPVALAGSNQGGAVLRPQGLEQPPLPAYDPAAGYLRQLGVQMFVRITDPTQATIRNVTVETNIVEISRTGLRNLGVEYGSATTLTETVDGAGNVTRTIDPTFNSGTVVAGNGFGGFGGFSQVNPFRARINALVTSGDARILSSPNVRALEGMPAQITIGGERPVPAATSAFGSTGQTVEFRRFGVIITMRPTVTDDNTIILQIRADVTQPDATYQINLNGAIIPGETVRSVDTTLTVRPGDTVVMGGLMTNEKRQQTSKVPVLGDIPIIGPLFRSRRFENNETELAIFMSPRIDQIPATDAGRSFVERAPSFPALPGRQEANQIFLNNTRTPG